MKLQHLVGGIALTSLLFGCSGESKPEPEIETGTIKNTPLPIIENFDGAQDIYDFFSASYRALATPSPAGSDNFYYSIAGLYSDKLEDYNEPVATETWLTDAAGTDAGNKAMRLGSSRFSIGQTVSDLAIPEFPWFDLRQKSSPGSAPDGVSWGELDLSQEYTVSFCLMAIGGLIESEKIQIFVDNNQSGDWNSVWAEPSRLYHKTLSQVQPLIGTRIAVTSNVGSKHSYIQIRAEGGGWFVMDDLVIEHTANPAPASAKPDCALKATDDAEVNPNPPVLPPTVDVAI